MSDIESRLAEIERRLADLEKNNHAPVDLTPFIRREIQIALERWREDGN